MIYLIYDFKIRALEFKKSDYMETKTLENEDLSFIDCPFSNSCVLPKKDFICKNPEFKVCPEFEVKKKKLR